MLTEIDKSNYIKGMLVLIKMKNKTEEPIKNSIKKLARILNFNQDFIEDSMNALMINKYIEEKPIKFSNFQIAQTFIKDGINLAFSDGTWNYEQVQWLINTARNNNLSRQWVFIELEEYFDRFKPDSVKAFEIQKLTCPKITSSDYPREQIPRSDLVTEEV